MSLSPRPGDVEEAVAAARRAFDSVWSKTTPGERAKLLNKAADLLDADAARMAMLETTDNGKVIRETSTQMGYAARIFRYYAGWADKMHGDVVPLDQKDTLDFAIRVPYGVVACVTAWNSPVAILTNTLPAALAAGNCVILKPSEHASTTTLGVAKIVRAGGLSGGRRPGRHRGGRCRRGADRQHRHRQDQLHRQRRRWPHDRLHGGRQPQAGDAWNWAANRPTSSSTTPISTARWSGALAGIFGATGQTCIAGSRLLVQRGIYDRMVEGLAARAGQIVMGDPRLPETEMGTAANEPQFNKILSFIEAAKGDGARLVAGGGRAEGPGLDKGFFIQPTIFADVRNDMKVAAEEIFGPVLSIIPFSDEEEAVQIANDTPYGLASGVWSENIIALPADDARDPFGRGLGQHLPRRRAAGAVWRHEGFGLRPGARRGGDSGIHPDQERVHRLLGRQARSVFDEVLK